MPHRTTRIAPRARFKTKPHTVPAGEGQNVPACVVTGEEIDRDDPDKANSVGGEV